MSADVDWKSLARKHEDRAKAKSAEVDDLRARLAAAEADAADARTELARHQIAAEYRLPLVLVTGEDKATMRAHAERVAAYRISQASTGRRKGQSSAVPEVGRAEMTPAFNSGSPGSPT